MMTRADANAEVERARDVQHRTDIALAAALTGKWDAVEHASGRERDSDDARTRFDFRLTGTHRASGGILVVTVTIGAQSPVTYTLYAEQALLSAYVIAAFPRFTWAALDRLNVARQRIVDAMRPVPA